MFRATTWLACACLAPSLLAQQAPPRPPAERLPQGWPAEDCNGNGVADLTDIYLGTSQDCQLDRIPDECQLAVPFGYQYAGEIDGAAGTDQQHVGWVTRFDTVAGHEVITGVELTWGYLAAGIPVTVGLWNDPDGDGEPFDARLLAFAQVLTSLSYSTVVVSLPSTYVGPAGTSFFVGAYGQFAPAPTSYPAALDLDSTALQSWFFNGPTPVNPDNLPEGMLEFNLIGKLCTGCDGDWGLAALSCSTGHCGESQDINGNAIPDECEPDCNGNGLPDDWDILQGYASDCDGDLIPDECQGYEDCDGNGLVDLCQQLTPFGLVGEYYANKTLSGEPLARIDPQVDFDFDQDPPFPGVIPTDDFSLRWTGSFLAPATGTYTFYPAHDDGVRLWVDGWPIVQDWSESIAKYSTGQIDLSAGVRYHLRLEYFEAKLLASMRLFWQPPGGSFALMQPYELSPLYDRDGDGIPDPCQVVDCNRNGFSDALDLSLGRSKDCNDDGIPDECQPELDCDDNGVPDSCEPGLPNGLVGQYWASPGGQGEFVLRLLVRVDPTVNFGWGNGSPDWGFQVDQFASRWTGTLALPAKTGTYTLLVKADDGVRLWVDGELLIDEWHDPTGLWYQASVDWTAGSKHLLRLEHYERSATASARLHWIVPGGTQVAIPQSALRPTTDLDGDGVPDACR